MTKNLTILTFFLIAIAIFLSCEKSEISYKNNLIQVSGIDLKPNSFEEDGVLKGIDVDIVKEIFYDAGINYELKIESSWEKIFEETKNGSNKALLTVGYSAELADMFKWVGPISHSQYIIFGNRDLGIEPYSNEKIAKNIASIGIVSDLFEVNILEEKGFANLVFFDSLEEMLNAYRNNSVNAIAGDAFQIIPSFSENDIINTIPIHRYKTVYYYMAFSKNTEDNIIEKCQKVLEGKIIDETTLAITKKYLPFSTKATIPGVIQIFTEVSPPLNFHTGTFPGLQPAGSSLEILSSIQARNEHLNYPELTSWTDAFEMVQYLPKSALLTMAKTKEREHLFQWVGPISQLKTVIYTRKEDGLSITKIEDAKVLSSIVTPGGWYTHEYLIGNNFTNFVITETPMESFEKFITGEVDALIMFETGAKWLCDYNNIPFTDLDGSFNASSEKGYIAFSLNTPPDIVQSWQKILNDIKEDGTFESIWRKWYGDLEMP